MQTSTDQSTAQKYKISKLSANRDHGTLARSTVKDEEDIDEIPDPELLPDQDEGIVDDDEGRFFGGGITKDTAEVLDFIDEQDKDHLRVSPR